MWLFALFLAVPLIEIALFIQIGGVIGLWPTLLVVVVTALIGTMLVRSQGAQELGRIRRSLDQLQDPTEPLVHGAMILVSGALLLTPGFFTDAVGFALLVPAVRTAAFRWLRARVRVHAFEGRGSDPRDPRSGPAGGTGPGRSPADRVIEGEYHEVDPDSRSTHRPSNWTRH